MFPFSFFYFWELNHTRTICMHARIGFLLPRSSEFPSMGFDLLDGLRTHLQILGLGDANISTQNVGFGDDSGAVFVAAEKLIMENDAQLIIVYATSLNAEQLYPLASTTGIPFLFVDAGMEFFDLPPNPNCFHITLQGLAACESIAKKAGEEGNLVLSATSFLDGGYRSVWAFERGLQEVGSSFSGHYVSHYQPAEFTLAPFTEQLEAGNAQAVVASFSSYLNQLFLTKLKEQPDVARSLPFYCAPYMADEMMLENIAFPGGNYNTVVPWASSLANAANTVFLQTIATEKKKKANLFHLLGWEAAIAAQKIIQDGIGALAGWSYESPRGTITFHPETHCAYGPIHLGQIVSGEKGNCKLQLNGTIEISSEDHLKQFIAKPTEGYSRWRNNYFCI
jgi:branched-chain amino acid transport system substrate-binding protein